MKKYLVVLFSAVLLVSLLALSGCGKKDTTEQTPAPQTTQPEQQQQQPQQPADKPVTDQSSQQATAQTADKPAADKAKQDAPKTEAPKPAAQPKTPFDNYLAGLPSRFNPANAQDVSCVYQFNITGENAGLYWVKIQDGKCTTGRGSVSNPSITINVGEQLWLDIADNKVNGTMAYLTKKFTAQGNTDYLSNMKKYFSK